MKVAILAGGKGQRLAEETALRPKALVEIGGHPIIWHLISYFERFGFDDFVIATGSQREKIEQYFLSCGIPESPNSELEPALAIRWVNGDLNCRVTLVDTGAETATGGRLKRLAPHLGEETFLLTWCDGLADVDLHALVDFHRNHKRLATLTAVRPPPRYGRLVLQRDDVAEFQEKAIFSEEWINGAFFVLEPAVLDRVADDETSFEHDVLSELAAEGQLKAYRHERFWACMDTIHDRDTLQAYWRSGQAPWKVWETKP